MLPLPACAAADQGTDVSKRHSLSVRWYEMDFRRAVRNFLKSVEMRDCPLSSHTEWKLQRIPHRCVTQPQLPACAVERLAATAEKGACFARVLLSASPRNGLSFRSFRRQQIYYLQAGPPGKLRIADGLLCLVRTTFHCMTVHKDSDNLGMRS